MVHGFQGNHKKMDELWSRGSIVINSLPTKDIITGRAFLLKKRGPYGCPHEHMQVDLEFELIKTQ